MMAAGVLATGSMTPALASDLTSPEQPGMTVTPILADASDEVAIAMPRIKVHNLQCRFSYSQEGVTPIEQIARNIGGTSAILCGDGHGSTRRDAEGADALDWEIEVTGAVANPFRSTLRNLVDDAALRRVMSYTCANNPADGRATANADVTGVPLDLMMDRASVDESANVVRFVAEDGYSMDMPLDYARQHVSMIAYRLNGEPLVRSIGATNQLWMGATSARYFVRDVVRIELLSLPASQIPASPGTLEAGDIIENRPNVGVLEGYSA